MSYMFFSASGFGHATKGSTPCRTAPKKYMSHPRGGEVLCSAIRHLYIFCFTSGFGCASTSCRTAPQKNIWIGLLVDFSSLRAHQDVESSHRRAILGTAGDRRRASFCIQNWKFCVQKQPRPWKMANNKRYIRQSDCSCMSYIFFSASGFGHVPSVHALQNRSEKIYVTPSQCEICTKAVPHLKMTN